MNAKLRLSVFDLADGETLLPEDDERVHFVYVRNGSARIAFDGTEQELAADGGCFAHGRVMVAPGSDVWLFEKSTTAAPPLDAEIVASYPAPLAFDGPSSSAPTGSNPSMARKRPGTAIAGRECGG